MKKHRIDDASNRMMQTVNDSQVINEMFDINDDQYDKIDTAATNFMVCLFLVFVCLFACVFVFVSSYAYDFMFV